MRKARWDCRGAAILAKSVSSTLGLASCSRSELCSRGREDENLAMEKQNIRRAKHRLACSVTSVQVILMHKSHKTKQDVYYTCSMILLA